jgi:hypothetical protein
MNLRNIFSVLILTAALSAEDTPEPSFKKQKVPILPHVWFSGELLWLKAQENGLTAANHAQNITPTPQFSNASLVPSHFHWNYGLKIDLGYQPKKLLYFVNWSTIHNTACSQKQTNGSKGFFPVLSLSNALTSSSYVTSSDCCWRLNTNIVNGGAVFSWQPSHYFILKSPVGLKIASLNQHLKTDYGGGVFSNGMDLLRGHNNFFGIGPLAGISPTIVLGKGFSLIGEFSASPLVGRFYVKQKESYLNRSLFHASHTMTRLSWALNARAVLSWQKELLYKALVFGVQAGWEWQEYYHQNHLSQNALDFFGSNRNLILRGGFLSLCVAF